MNDLTKLDDKELEKLNESIQNGLKLVDDIVLKNYISSLEELEIIPLDEELKENNIDRIRLFNITKMVYKKDEASSYKFASIFNAVASTNSSLITIINSDGKDTKFYLGVRTLIENNSPATPFEVLGKSIQGQFPGIKLENLKNNRIEELLKSINSESVASVSCVANNKNKDFIDNNKYLQGLEKLALAMQGEKYSAIIIANPLSQNELTNVRKSYEDIYTNIAPLANVVLNYGKNYSITDTTSTSDAKTYGTNKGGSRTFTENESINENIGEVVSVSKQSTKSKVASILGGALGVVGALSGGAIGGAVGSLVGSGISAAFSENITKTSGGGNKSKGFSTADGETWGENESDSHTESNSKANSSGDSQSAQFTRQNKSILAMLERIDNQLKRVNEFESLGMWECAAYFLSPSLNTSKVGAATYKSLMAGENTGLEISAINTWTKSLRNEFDKNALVVDYVKSLIHPRFIYRNNFGVDITVSPASLVSSNELAIHMGLPRNSVSGFPVVEHIDFGKEIVKYDSNDESKKISLGNIFNMGKVIEENKVELDLESLIALPETYYTAFGSFLNLKIEEKDSVLVRGATSGVGIAFAKLLKGKFPKIHLTGTSRNLAKEQQLKAVGFDQVILDKDGVLHTKEQFDKVLDLVGPSAILDTFARTAEGGIVCSCGLLGGQWTVPDFDPIEMLSRNLYLTTFASANVSQDKLQELVDFVECYHVDVGPEKVYKIDQIQEVHAYLEGSYSFGKVIVKIEED